jgi:AcrR family transcriptional regulator
MSDQRPYATLLAKGEDRRQRIIAVAQQLLTRNGWRGTTLGQIAKGSGISVAGLMHHFESKEHLLQAVLDARDLEDDLSADLLGDLTEELAKVPERYLRAPETVGTFIILLTENLEPDAPLRERLLRRHHDAVDIVAENIRFGQREGRYRDDLDPHVKAVEIIAFVNGMETSWLLDPSLPLTEVFRAYAESLAAQLAPPA